MNRTAMESRLILWGCVVAFVLLKTNSLKFSTGDENIYFYLADQVADGALPYRDFFHAHPPFHLASLSLLNWAGGGFDLLTARLLAIGSTIGAALMLARLAPGVGARVAVLGSAVYLLSFDVLRVSTHPVGTNLAAFWVALALERLSKEKDLQAAAAFCFGGFTMLVVAPAAVGATLVLFLVNPRRGARLAIFGALGIAALNLCAFIAFGSVYIDQVYLFHLGKSAAESTTLQTFVAIVQGNGVLLATTSMGAFALLLGVDVKTRNEQQADAKSDDGSLIVRMRSALSRHLTLSLAIGAALGSLLFLLWANRIFIYYFQVLFVCVAPLAGYGLAALVQTGRDAIMYAELDASKVGEARLAFGVLLVLLFAGQLPGLKASDGQNMTVVSQYLAHEADWFESAQPLADQVKLHCGEQETVFGDSTAAPLVALLAGRTLSLGEADTNQMRFTSGQVASGEFIAQLEENPPCAVVYREQHGIFAISEFAAWLGDHYENVFEARNALGTRRFELLLRKPEQTTRS